jgi:ATP phosphoribosyltransferase regulatory subunit HisZ
MARYDWAVLTEFKVVFAEQDVEGLIALGAPRDEYDSEATEVAQKLKDLESVVQVDHAAVLKVLLDVWGVSFNLKGAELERRREELTKLASKVEALCVK